MTDPARKPIAPALRNALIGVAAMLIMLTGAGGGYVVWLVTKPGGPAADPVAVAAVDVAPSPTGEPSPSPELSPTPSVAPSPTGKPSPRPTKTPTVKSSPKPTAKIKALSLQSSKNGSLYTATITATVTGTGPVRIRVDFTYPKGGVETGYITRTVTVNGTGGQSVQTVTTSVPLKTVCAHPDTPLGPGIGVSVQVPPYGDFSRTDLADC
ncbi:hypothetical protein Cme02nite_56210 [Catellatospora methionotrophica]|uniref:Uncharacterized protein n=1 Tax=Catellatospora methionotrophica TaxID=121620 RepID=A0A8J3LKH3_9ACTN|nr:hypothetical protein [Catellatospora methionotrophica]GIG17289.1 hypothetical protein Cme02nite_56210 [Catellatospora methionotrophica]